MEYLTLGMVITLQIGYLKIPMKVPINKNIVLNYC